MLHVFVCVAVISILFFFFLFLFFAVKREVDVKEEDFFSKRIDVFC